MLEVDTLLQGRYRILGQIGKGGMGTVFRAKDQNLGLSVAIKQNFFEEDRLIEAFKREARLLAGLRHPALAQVKDYFIDESGQYLVMEYIGGDDLGVVLEKRRQKIPPAGVPKPFEVEHVVQWAEQLLDALDYLHSRAEPVIHRDIKPQNLRLGERGQIILLDFGLAKGKPLWMTRVTSTGSLYGYTPHYAPIEQIRGLGTDPRSDLYALGATLYHLITGEAPIDAATRAECFLGGETDPLRLANEVNVKVPPAIAAALNAAMQPHRNNRPPGAGVLLTLLRSAKHSSFIHSDAWQDEAPQPDEAELKAIEEAERRRQEEAELKAREEAEQRRQEEVELKAKEEAELKAWKEAEQRRQEEAELKAREEAELNARKEAERRRQEKAELKAKEEAELKAWKEAEQRRQEEAELKAREEAEQRRQEEVELKAKEEAELKARKEAEQQEEERKAREAEQRRQEEAELKAWKEAEQRWQEETERKAREEAELNARKVAERRRQEEVELKAREEQERRRNEELLNAMAAAERKQQAEQERRLNELVERRRREEEEEREAPGTETLAWHGGQWLAAQELAEPSILEPAPENQIRREQEAELVQLRRQQLKAAGEEDELPMRQASGRPEGGSTGTPKRMLNAIVGLVDQVAPHRWRRSPEPDLSSGIGLAPAHHDEERLGQERLHRRSKLLGIGGLVLIALTVLLVISIVKQPDKTATQSQPAESKTTSPELKPGPLATPSRVSKVAMSDDGRVFASVGDEKPVRLWLAGAKRELSGQTRNSRSVAISRDGRLVASGSEDGTICLWNVGDGALLKSWKGHTDFVFSLGFSADGQLLCSAGADRSVSVWRISDKASIRSVKTFGNDLIVTISPDHRLVGLYRQDGRFYAFFWTDNGLVEAFDIKVPDVVCGAFSIDGQVAALGSGQGDVLLCNVGDGRVIRTLPKTEKRLISIAFSADGKTLAVGFGDGTITLWRVSDGKLMDTLEGHTRPVNSLSFSADGRTLISGSNDKTVRVWQVVD